MILEKVMITTHLVKLESLLTTPSYSYQSSLTFKTLPQTVDFPLEPSAWCGAVTEVVHTQRSSAALCHQYCFYLSALPADSTPTIINRTQFYKHCNNTVSMVYKIILLLMAATLLNQKFHYCFNCCFNIFISLRCCRRTKLKIYYFSHFLSINRLFSPRNIMKQMKRNTAHMRVSVGICSQ